jgi:adenylate cyclase
MRQRELATARGRYRLKLTLLTSALVVIPVIVVGWLALRSFRSSLEEQVKERLYSSIDEVSALVDRELRDAQRQLEATAIILSQQSVTPSERITRATQMLGTSQSLSSIAIYDEAGKQVDVMRRQGDQATFAPTLDPTLAAASATASASAAHGDNQRAVGEPLVQNSGDRSGVYLPVAWTFQAAADQPTIRWTLVSNLDVAPLSQRLAELSDKRFEAQPDSLLVFDRDWHIVATADSEATDSSTNVALLQQGKRYVQTLGSTTSTNTLAVIEYEGTSGTMIAGVRSLASAPLMLLSQVSKQRAFAAVTRMRNEVLLVAGFAVITGLLAGLFLARRMSKPIATLVQYADALAKRKFDTKLSLRTGDEMEVLGNALTNAATGILEGENRLRDEQSIRNDLGRYLPAQLVDRIATKQHQLQLGGIRQTATIVFADVASFTSLVEQHPPEVVSTVINQLFTLLTELVFRHGGTVDKFMGDCVMAFWNAPDPQDDHVARAVRCSKEMSRWLESANVVWEKQHGITIYLSIGIHSGDVIVGNFGSQTRMEYTCIGSTVNVAARLEHLARPGQILASAQVQQQAPNAANYIDLGKTNLPGRQEAISVVEVTD